MRGLCGLEAWRSDTITVTAVAETAIATRLPETEQLYGV